MKIETVGQYRAQWGEGAVWWQGALLYVDIEGHRVLRFDPESGEEQSWEVGQRVGTVVPTEQGRLLAAGDHGFFSLDPESGELQALSDPEPDLPDNRFNDGKCAPNGDFYAGTISLVKKEGTAKLYRLQPSGEVSVAYEPVTNSNGICWSVDGTICYYIDTSSKEVKAFDFIEGHLRNPRSVVSTEEHEGQSPDGMTIDENGHLWIAFCHGAAVRCYDPVSGQQRSEIALPCLETTSVAFGGKDLADLYVTTGIHKTQKEPDAGRLFRLSGLGVRGIPAQPFKG